MAPRALLAAATLAGGAAAVDNGLGLTPPMGWRSWNCYANNIDQAKMQSVMDKVASRSRLVNGKPTSLADLGYVDVGLDDNWQWCNHGVNGSFHDAEGHPLINLKRFPSMKGMTDYAHELGLTAGWYMNNCDCAEHSFKTREAIETHMKGSAAAVAEYGFDGVKLDGCGQFLNLTWWAELLNATGRHIMIENCHWGGTVPGHPAGLEEPQPTSSWADLLESKGLSPLAGLGGPAQSDGPCTGTTTPSDCPYNFFRTSGDISASWGSMFNNLQTTVPYLGDPPLARPGTWAYPDMLEVGNLASFEEDRSHFGAWVITSSPLILGFDVNNETTMDKVWPIITNKEAIAISQAWAGHPGKLVKSWKKGKKVHMQMWAKPVGGGRKAVFVISNDDQESHDAHIAFEDLELAGRHSVRCVWKGKDLGEYTSSFRTGPIAPHDSHLLLFTPHDGDASALVI